MNYLKVAGIEQGSVWRDSQLTSYWSRAVVLDRQMRTASVDPINARQQFAKHANAARALFSTLVTQQNGGNYESGKNITVVKLYESLADTKPLFIDSASFNTQEYWYEELEPFLDATQTAVRNNLPTEVNWEDVVASTVEFDRHKAAIEPLGIFLLNSFHVISCFVYCDGPLPQPGVPSGTVLPWHQV